MHLYGAIPSGPLEGALRLEFDPGDDSRVSGQLFRADKSISEAPIELRFDSNGQLLLRLGSSTHRRLSWVREIDPGLLNRVRIIGHRGGDLGLATLCNSKRAIETAWDRGCSGVEIDFLIPHRRVDGKRIPQPQDIYAYHVDGLVEGLTGEDGCDIAQIELLQPGPIRASAALDAWAATELTSLYIDPKLKWLLKTDLKSAGKVVDSIIDKAAHVSEPLDSGRRILIAAERTCKDETGDLLARSLAGSEAWSTGVRWMPEFSNMTNPNRFAEYFFDAAGAAPPSAISLNLLAVHAGLDSPPSWFVKDMNPADEGRYRETGLPVIVWNANSESEFRRALRILDRFVQRDGTDASCGILTDYPHRLAYFLAVSARLCLTDPMFGA